MTHVFPASTPVMRLSLAFSKQIEATGNHPFLTYQGWRPLADLAVGARLAVPRTFLRLSRSLVCEAEVIMLAHVLGLARCPATTNSLRQPRRKRTFRRGEPPLDTSESARSAMNTPPRG